MNTPENSPLPKYQPRQNDKQAPCQLYCASGADVRSWLAIIAQRGKTGLSRRAAYQAAWRKLVEENPLPATLGRICPHPCEENCNRGGHDGSVAVHLLERFLGDYAIESGWRFKRKYEGNRSQSAAVIGSGPAGLSFTYQMARRGYPVTIYDAHPKLGGMLRYGVPAFRLPDSVLDAEIRRIVDLGVQVRLSCKIGRDKNLQELKNSHDAIYLAPGAQKGMLLRVAGMTGSGCLSGVDYLELVARGAKPQLGEVSAIIGGGNSAIDAARCARRQGAQATIYYRRGLEEMPAQGDELQDAMEEGVEIVPWVQLVQVERGADNQVIAAWFCRTQPGPKDESGRARPQVLSGSEFRVDVNSVVYAISQIPDLKGFQSDGTWLRPDAAGDLGDKLWAGGDVIGLGIAGSAIGQGRLTAEVLHQRLSGGKEREDAPSLQSSISPDRIRLDQRESQQPAKTDKHTGDDRLAAGMQESEQALTEEAFLSEVERCFSCGACSGCGLCYMYCTSDCFTPVEDTETGNYFMLDTDACRACGKCIEICPGGYLELA